MKNLIILLILLSATQVYCQTQEAKMKAIYIYNFTKNIAWSNEQESPSFVVGVLGRSEVYAELGIIAQKKKVGTKTMVVKRYKTLQEIAGCHLLFVSEQNSASINELAANAAYKNMLIITEKEGAIKQGAAINLLLVNGNLKFEISKTNIEKSGLHVSQSLLSLGILADK